ncbi:MAG: MotA/TolQ/ExbB proton channel family protein [Planctomycetes bacterium]|nr:MotA/TolQ/ExbB proton channel family protein [Planctomycetota bacterium]
MFWEYIEKGGVVWMTPILLAEVVALAFTLERTWFWFQRRLRASNRKRLVRAVLAAPLDRAKSLALLAGSRELTLAPHYVLLSNSSDVDLEIAERRGRDRAEEVLAECRRSSRVLSFIGNMSCTLGLLGTVVGVAMALEDIALRNPKGLLIALSVALYTTIAGIFLFFLCAISLSIFSRFADDMEERLAVELNRVKELLVLEAAKRPSAEPAAEG